MLILEHPLTQVSSRFNSAVWVDKFVKSDLGQEMHTSKDQQPCGIVQMTVAVQYELPSQAGFSSASPVFSIAGDLGDVLLIVTRV
jgi:hypothetical protein